MSFWSKIHLTVTFKNNADMSKYELENYLFETIEHSSMLLQTVFITNEKFGISYCNNLIFVNEDSYKHLITARPTLAALGYDINISTNKSNVNDSILLLLALSNTAIIKSTNSIWLSRKITTKPIISTKD